MRISTEDYQGIKIISLIGKIDSSTYRELESEMLRIAEQPPGKILVDCSQLEFLSSSGIRVFYLVAKKLEKFNGKLVFMNPNENILRVFEIIDFSSDFSIQNDLAGALKEF